jgi:hypothetical protein
MQCNAVMKKYDMKEMQEETMKMVIREIGVNRWDNFEG